MMKEICEKNSTGTATSAKPELAVTGNSAYPWCNLLCEPLRLGLISNPEKKLVSVESVSHPCSIKFVSFVAKISRINSKPIDTF